MSMHERDFQQQLNQLKSQYRAEALAMIEKAKQQEAERWKAEILAIKQKNEALQKDLSEMKFLSRSGATGSQPEKNCSETILKLLDVTFRALRSDMEQIPNSVKAINLVRYHLKSLGTQLVYSLGALAGPSEQNSPADREAVSGEIVSNPRSPMVRRTFSSADVLVAETPPKPVSPLGKGTGRSASVVTVAHTHSRSSPTPGNGHVGSGRYRAALEVQCVDWHKTEGRGSHVLFHLCSTMVNGEKFFVHRRYKDFLWLEQRLLDAFPGVCIASLPPKRHVGKFVAQVLSQDEFTESRMMLLEEWLSGIIWHPIVCSCGDVRRFLRVSRSQFSEVKSSDEPLCNDPTRPLVETELGNMGGRKRDIPIPRPPRLQKEALARIESLTNTTENLTKQWGRVVEFERDLSNETTGVRGAFEEMARVLRSDCRVSAEPVCLLHSALAEQVRVIQRRRLGKAKSATSFHYVTGLLLPAIEKLMTHPPKNVGCKRIDKEWEHSERSQAHWMAKGMLSCAQSEIQASRSSLKIWRSLAKRLSKVPAVRVTAPPRPLESYLPQKSHPRKLSHADRSASVPAVHSSSGALSHPSATRPVIPRQRRRPTARKPLFSRLWSLFTGDSDSSGEEDCTEAAPPPQRPHTPSRRPKTAPSQQDSTVKRKKREHVAARKLQRRKQRQEETARRRQEEEAQWKKATADAETARLRREAAEKKRQDAALHEYEKQRSAATRANEEAKRRSQEEKDRAEAERLACFQQSIAAKTQRRTVLAGRRQPQSTPTSTGDSRSSSAQRPRTGQAKGQQPPSPQRSASRGHPIPQPVAVEEEEEEVIGDAVEGAAGWVEVRMEDGRAYYYHSVTRTTRWEKPTGDVAEKMEERIQAEARESKLRARERLQSLKMEEQAEALRQMEEDAAKASVDAAISRWTKGCERNLPRLLETVHTVISGLKVKDKLTGASDGAVRKTYLQTLRRVHPDKLAGMDMGAEHNLLARRVFSVLSEAFEAWKN